MHSHWDLWELVLFIQKMSSSLFLIFLDATLLFKIMSSLCQHEFPMHIIRPLMDAANTVPYMPNRLITFICKRGPAISQFLQDSRTSLYTYKWLHMFYLQAYGWLRRRTALPNSKRCTSIVYTRNFSTQVNAAARSQHSDYEIICRQCDVGNEMSNASTD